MFIKTKDTMTETSKPNLEVNKVQAQVLITFNRLVKNSMNSGSNKFLWLFSSVLNSLVLSLAYLKSQVSSRILEKLAS